MNVKIVFLLNILFLLLSCNSEDELIPLNDSLLFPNTTKLEIDVVHGNTANGFSFDVRKTQSDLIFIGIFKEYPEVIDEILVNQNALVWEWKGSTTEMAKIYLADGKTKGNSIDIINTPECINKDLYWFAWGWGGNARKITHSSLIHSLDLASLPSIQFYDNKLIEEIEGNEDGAISAGELVVMQLMFKNYGLDIVKNVNIELISAKLEDLSASVFLGNIAPNQIISYNIEFRVPIDSRLGEMIPIKAFISYNRCTIEQNIEIEVTGINVSLKSLILTDVTDRSILNLDVGLPDLYYLIISNNMQDTIESYVIPNVPIGWNDSIYVGWYSLAPIPLKKDETYHIQIWDYDDLFLDNDDFVGSGSFSPASFFETRDTSIVLENDQIQLKLELEWGN